MIRLARHIEILLLDNECVIVPNLGGFVAHRVVARYDGDEELFLPPYRTLGFNPMLKMNDSLLAQSYVEAYDLSYPEAVSAIEDEVREMLRIMGNTGSYELENLGRLFYDHDGKMNFEPCESGILTPQFYAFSSFEMPLLPADKEVPATVEAEVAEEKPRAIYIAKEGGRRTLNISLKAVRNTAVAAVVVATVGLIAFPIAHRHGAMTAGNIESGFYEMLIPHSSDGQAKTAAFSARGTGSKTAAPTNAETTAAKTGQAQASEATATEKNTEAAATASDDGTDATAPASAGSHWSIVVCSHVPRANAEALAAKLRKEGRSDVIVSTTGAVKVLYGHFKTKDEAHKRLNDLVGDDTFKDSWLLEVKE